MPRSEVQPGHQNRIVKENLNHDAGSQHRSHHPELQFS